MSRALTAAATLIATAGLTQAIIVANAADSEIERGKYLVTVASCGDCHTPGYFFGRPDTARLLGGGPRLGSISRTRRRPRAQPYSGRGDRPRRLDG